MRSLEVTSPFLPITCDQKEIETWDRCQCDCLVKMRRLIYNMTYLGHLLTLTYLDLNSNMILTFQGHFIYLCFDAPWRDKDYAAKIVVLSLKSKTLSSKTTLFRNWPFDLWWPQFRSELKKWLKQFRNDFCRAFGCRLCDSIFQLSPEI